MTVLIGEKFLQKFYFASQRRFSNAFLGAGIYIDPDVVADAWVAEVHAYIWAEDMGRYEMQYPADWWQAFKERWLPAWAKARWPVKWTVEVVDIKALYPNFKYAVPNGKHVIKAVKYKFPAEMWQIEAGTEPTEYREQE